MKKTVLLLLLASGILHAQETISLEQAMNLALRHNPELQQARQVRRAAAGRVWSGMALPQPELSYAYEYLPLGKSLSHFGERTIEVAQEFDFPTTYLLRGRALNAETVLARTQLRRKALALLSDVQRAYWEVKAREAQLIIAETNCELAAEFSRKAAIRQEAGEGSLLEKLTAQVQSTQAQNAMESAQGERSAALARLVALLGRERDSGTWVLTDTLTYQPRSLTLEELEAAAWRQSPDLLRAEIAVSTLRTRQALSWSSLLPSFRLGYSRQALEGGGNDYYGVAFGATIPLWFLFDQRGRVQEATAELRGGEFEQTALRNELSARLHTAWLEYTNQERQVRLFQNELLPQANEIYRTATVSYDAGEIGYLELLQSRQTVAGMHAGYIDALVGYKRASIELNELAGEVPTNIHLNEE